MYAHEAIDKGASYAIVDEKQYASGEKLILVEDVLKTLQNLANYHRHQLKAIIIAITGSNGKTTTKELIKNVLSEKFITIATKGNLNNHIGVPLTLLSMQEETRYAVIEMGANHPGEIRELCNIAEPDMGLITNIGKAHLEGFGDIGGVARSKGEMYEYLSSPGKIIFYNNNNDLLKNILPRGIKAVPYGTGTSLDLYGELLSASPFLKFNLVIKKGGRRDKTEFVTRLSGDYNLENVLAAISIGIFLNIPLKQVKRAVESYIPADNRSQVINTTGNRVILDAYNANPTSMYAALTSFLSQKDKDEKILIIGEMRELGKYSNEEHKKLVGFLRKTPDVMVFFVGECFYPFKTGDDYYFSRVDDLIEWLKDHKIKNASVLIKGSRANKLEKLIDYL